MRQVLVTLREFGEVAPSVQRKPAETLEVVDDQLQGRHLVQLVALSKIQLCEWQLPEAFGQQGQTSKLGKCLSMREGIQVI